MSGLNEQRNECFVYSVTRVFDVSSFDVRRAEGELTEKTERKLHTAYRACLSRFGFNFDRSKFRMICDENSVVKMTLLIR